MPDSWHAATTDSDALTHDTVPTEFLDAGAISFAYRRFGSGPRTPIVLTQYFRGNMDNFDPAITDALAAEREVILFDNTGVGASSGPARDTVEDMAADAATFIAALDLGPVDLFGHSMGGEVAQLVALTRPELVRRLVLVGTGPRGGEGMAVQRPTTAELFAKVYEETLVVNGSNDIVIATVNSFILQQHLPEAYLVLYPDSNHGTHFQYTAHFLTQLQLFLER